MNKELTIIIAGEAGQGMQTIGHALCRLYKSLDLFVFSNQDYMSRVRGGDNYYQLRVSDRPCYAHRRKADILIALDKQSVALHSGIVVDKGLTLLDRKKFALDGKDPSWVDIPFYDIAVTTAGSELYVNTVAFGAVAGLTGVAFDDIERVVSSIFSDKPESVVRQNIDCAKKGYDSVSKRRVHTALSTKKGTSSSPTMLINGNEAIALGAIRAGCKFYTAYPMTPSTSILNTVAEYAQRFNIVVEQAEDEIAAVNMAIGASYAGVRSMTGTSGGGFALMGEGISLAGMTETPVVIVDAQRPAPATGFPTRTEQADLDFVLHAGHGEFARVVYAPGTIEECFYLTVKAFNIADRYQIPVIILTDQYLADSYRNIVPFDLSKEQVKRFIISREESSTINRYKRYQLTESGISPRAIPSWIDDAVYADSDEHTEEGHITEDAGIRKTMVEKRLYKKMRGLQQEIVRPTTHNTMEAEIMLIGFGSTYGVLKETCAAVAGKEIGFVHFSQVWPFPSQEAIKLLARPKRIMTVENNAAGQLAKLITRETGITIPSSILKYDGRPFSVDEIVERL